MIWLIGSKGMLGSDVELILKSSSIEYIASDKEIDITDINKLKNLINNIPLRWIINCSAYTAVDKAEDEKDLAYAVNSDGVKNISIAASEKEAKLIHLSTDYVYDGSKLEEYYENDHTSPINIYGASKLAGEKHIGIILKKYFIIRTAWLYGLNGPNFVKTMLRLFNEKDSLNVVNDQFGSPTYSRDLAQAILNIIQSGNSQYGIYHYTNEGKTNWFDFALEIKRIAVKHELLKKEIEINPVSSDQYPVRAHRPQNSVLSKAKIKQNMNIQIRNWEIALEEYIIRYKEFYNEKT